MAKDYLVWGTITTSLYIRYIYHGFYWDKWLSDYWLINFLSYSQRGRDASYISLPNPCRKVQPPWYSTVSGRDWGTIRGRFGDDSRTIEDDWGRLVIFGPWRTYWNNDSIIKLVFLSLCQVLGRSQILELGNGDPNKLAFSTRPSFHDIPVGNWEMPKILSHPKIKHVHIPPYSHELIPEPGIGTAQGRFVLPDNVTHKRAGHPKTP